MAWFPQLYAPTEVIEGSASIPFFNISIPVIAGTGDAVFQPYAAGVNQSNSGLLVLGTGGNVSVLTDTFKHNQHSSLQYFCGVEQDSYVVMGATLSAGESFRWLRNLLNEVLAMRGAPPLDFAELIQYAFSEPVHTNGPVFTPYLQGERCPYTDPEVRASLLGLSSLTSLAGIIHSVLEGISHSLKDVYNCLQDIGIEVESVILMGGGGKSPEWAQLMTDIFNKPLSVSSTNVGGTAYGAALLAANRLTGDGGIHRISPSSDKITVYNPSPANASLMQVRHRHYRSIYGRTRDLFG